MAIATLLVAGCNRGSSAPAGAAVWPFNLPLGGPSPAAMTPTNAFPMLGFTRPVFATHAPDGTDRIFVVEQAGRILVFPNDPAVTGATEFLDIQSRVTSSGEQGLLGLAFDPDYATSGALYVYYSANSPRRSVIARFTVTADPNVADPGSEEVLLTVAQPFPNHNAGMIAFGPDDMLYIALGDGGSGGDPFGNAQDLTTLLGSVLRIDPNGGSPYAIPPDNPFVGLTGGEREEIWAYGFRNPWRFSFDRQTGDLWLADVGQNEREEVNRVVKGGNYGWNVFEGTRSFDNPLGLPSSDFAEPVIDYGHGLGVAVAGGYVYRGAELQALRGAYLYGDYFSGTIWALTDNAGTVTNTVIANIGLVNSFGEDQNGELLAVSHAGTIYRLEPSAGSGDPFPQFLSETGLFTDVANLVPTAPLHEYDLNSQLWSDGAHKRRWIASPLARIGFDPTEAWSFPVGSVLVKHFELELTVGDPLTRRRLETRVLLRDDVGWSGYTYKWNDQQTDAELLGGRLDEDYTITDPFAPGGQRTQTWTYPSRTDCMRCHTEPAGRILGPRTRQLNRVVGGENQIDTLLRVGVLAGAVRGGNYESYPEPADPAVSYAERARAYLAANCSNCHLPRGPTPAAIDLRWGVAEDQMGLLDLRPAISDLGLPDAWLVLPGNKESSVLWERMRRTTGDRMPPLGSHETDPLGIDVVGRWIDGLN